MYEAFLSARIAAEATLDLLAGRARGLEPYGAALSHELDPLHATGRRARLALDQFPWIVFAIARAGVSWRIAEAFLAGDVRQSSDARGLARVPLTVLAAAALRKPGRRESAPTGQKPTTGASRCAGSSTSKNSRTVKPNGPAKTTPGNVWIRLS